MSELETNINQQRDVFVPQSKEEEYLQAHKIEYRKLSNGITLLGVPRQVEDVASAEVVFSFPRGSYHDPAGKEGIHHLLEHLIMNPIGEAPERMHSHVNAHTGPIDITVEVEGVANPDVQGFGVWPILGKITESIKNPLVSIQGLDKVLKKEIDVVMGEKGEFEDSWSRQRGLFVRRTLFDPANPVLADGLGTEESLKSITPEDIVKLAEDVFIPHGMVASFLTTGEVRTCKELADKLEGLLRDYPRSEKVNFKTDPSLFERMNDEFLPGKVFVNQQNTRKRAEAMMAWVFPSDDFSAEAYALQRLLPLINYKLFNYFRQNGMGYSATASSETSDGLAMVFINLDLPNRPELALEFKEDIYPTIRGNVLEEIAQEDFTKINSEEDLLQKAIPMPVNNRFGLMREGIEKYGRIIDADEVKKLYLDITPKHLSDWRDKLAGVEPVFIIS